MVDGHHIQAGRKRRRSPTSSISLIITSVAVSWHQFLSMNKVTAASSSAVMFGYRQCITIRSLRSARGSGGSFSTQHSMLAFANNPMSDTLPSSSYHSYPTSSSSRKSCTTCIHQPSNNNRRISPLQYRQSMSYCTSQLFLQQQNDDNIVSINSDNDEHWKSLVHDLNETLELPSISVPSKHVHWLLSDKSSPLRPYLATQMVELEGVHPKIKVVRDCHEQITHDDLSETKLEKRKRILLDSHLGSTTAIIAHDGKSMSPIELLMQQYPKIPKQTLQQLVTDYDIKPDKSESIHIPYKNQPISRILTKILPPDPNGLPPPSSYEQIGHVAHFNLRQVHLPYGKLIGQIMLDRLQPSIRTVVNKLGEVGGPYRTYNIDLLAGEDDYNVHVVEHGISLYFDLRNVYWCTRLEGERTYMIQHEFKPNQVIADAFCGVGALCIRAAINKGCRIIANDLNPDAVEHCKDSARRNGIGINEDDSSGKFQVQCGDASQFIMNLGVDDGHSLPDHLLLNFPLDSSSFLNALRWWPSSSSSAEQITTRTHVYTFARADTERTASEVAIDMVADGLLPEGGYVEPSKFRGGYLNELGCDVQAREIRDAAPGKLVIYVSFSVTRLLLRRMQGDYD